ncbi:MAG: ABC transporter permease [Bacilli bacterium]
MTQRWSPLLMPLYAVLTGLILGGVIMAIAKYNPFAAYAALFSGAFGSPTAIGNTLAGAVPLILAGLGIAVAFRTGLFNIGAEGQYWVGAMAAVWVGYHFPTMPWIVHVPLALGAAMLAGGIWGGVIPGLAKAFVGAHEVITTMMMSYIAILIAHFMVEKGPMMAPGYVPQSPTVAASATLPPILPAVFLNSNLSDGFFVAAAAIVVVHIVLFHTTLGYKLRAVGFNARAARYAGMNVPLYTVLALGVSGVLAGLAGGVQLLGVDFQLTDTFQSGYGYTAIVVALLARNNPIGIFFASVFFAALSAGSQIMQINAGVSANMTDVITGIIIFFVATDRLYGYWSQKMRPHRPPSAAAVISRKGESPQ